MSISKYLRIAILAISVVMFAAACSSSTTDTDTGSTSSPTTTAGGGETATTSGTSNYTGCAKRYGELVRDLTLAGKINATDAQRWASQAQQAAQAATANPPDLSKALSICQGTVGEMDKALNG